MQIVLKRIAKKKTYTIGRLYILKDEDVKKRTIESVNKCRGLKTVCEVPAEKLNADSYFCDTLAVLAQSSGCGAESCRGECAVGACIGQEGAEDEGQDGDT